MKNIIKHTILIAGVALMATACQKELSLSDKEGNVSFNIQMEPITRTGENDITGETDFVPDNVKVRIYRPARTGETGEQLIRRYLSIADIPNPLYLIAGSYSVKVDGGDTSNTAFKEPGTDAERQKKLCYYGTRNFVINAQENSDIDVECKTINTKVNVGFDINDSEKDRANDSGYTDDGKPSKYENRKLKDVKITIAAITTTATTVDAFEDDVTEQKAPKLVFAGSEFTETKTVNSGYFLVPDGVTTLVWAFEGTHEDDGAVAQLGTINMANVRGYAHTVNFNYSRTPDGFVGITVKVDDAVEICEDSFYFKAQPQITGQMVENGTSTGLDIEGNNIFKQGNSLSLTCEGINDLTDISLGGVEFFNDGEVVDDAIEGLAANKVSATKVTFTISQDYFNTLNGSTQELRFVMTDTEDDPCEQVLKIRKRGIMAGEGEQTYDLWNNTATIQAFVPEATDNSTVEIKCKRADATAYIAMTTPTKSVDSPVWTATTIASWPQATTNRNSKTIYIPDSSLGIYANNAYTYELWVNEEKVDEYILTPTVSQIIIDADFEKGDLYCYGQPANNIPDGQIWGSGNNGYTEDDPLCRYEGSGTNHYARLSSCVAGVTGIAEMLAAGNLFTGDFYRPGTRGTVSFGIKYQWQARPTALKFKYWGDIGTVDRTDKSTIHIAKGQPDQASVYVAIVAWDAQRPVTSGTGDPDGMWSPEDGADATTAQGKIIGYGVAYPTGKTNNDGNLVEYEVPIVYYDTTTNPSNSNYSLVISFATSRYGDYMNGCSDSNMYIDDVEWSYSSTFSNRFPYDTTQTPQ